MNRAYVKITNVWLMTDKLTDPAPDPELEFLSGSFGEGESHDVLRFRQTFSYKVGYACRNKLRLTGTGTGDYLKVSLRKTGFVLQFLQNLI